MTTNDSIPNPWELGDLPELASLFLLEQALDVVTRVLFSAHPQVYDHEVPLWVLQKCPPSVFIAKKVVSVTELLCELLHEYRSSIIQELNQAILPDRNTRKF